MLATLLVQQVIALHRALHSGSHVQFFKLVAQLPYLPACLCHAYFQDLRKLSVSTLHAAGRCILPCCIACNVPSSLLGTACASLLSVHI